MLEYFLKILVELVFEIHAGYNFNSCCKLKAQCPFSEIAIFFTCLLKATQYLFHEVLYIMRRYSRKIACKNDDPKWEFSEMVFFLRRIYPSTKLYFKRCWINQVQEFACINQVAQEIWGGAVICLTIRKSTLLQRTQHSTQTVLDSFDVCNVGMFKKTCEALSQVLINL